MLLPLYYNFCVNVKVSSSPLNEQWQNIFWSIWAPEWMNEHMHMSIIKTQTHMAWSGFGIFGCCDKGSHSSLSLGKEAHYALCKTTSQHLGNKQWLELNFYLPLETTELYCALHPFLLQISKEVQDYEVTLFVWPDIPKGFSLFPIHFLLKMYAQPSQAWLFFTHTAHISVLEMG